MSSFWTDERIHRTVNSGYVLRTLGSRCDGKLNHLLPHGEGLTELTYLDYIVLRCPRLFLVLTELGCPENIFGAIENNLDDGELPIPDLPGAMNGLALKNMAQARKFQKLQHLYHVQDLEEGAQLRFSDSDVVPISSIPRLKGASLPDAFDVVKVKGIQLWRRSLQLEQDNGFGDSEFERKFILMMQRIKHVHLSTIWATYTYHDYGYLLLQPYINQTLDSFMNDPPRSFKQLSMSRQRVIVTHWIQCLAAALEHLHDYGLMHRAIRPSNIYIDEHFQICLGPYLAQGAAADEPSEDAFKRDVYDHAPPESYLMRHKLARGEGSNVALQGGGRTRRRVQSSLSETLSSSNRPVTPSTVRSPQSPPFSPGETSQMTSAAFSPNRFLERPSTASSTETVRVSVNVVNYNPPQPQKGWSKTQDTQFFPSDVFSLTTTYIKIFSFLASVISPGSGTTPAKIHEYLGKTRSNAGRGGAIPDRSFHANLGQVNLWLDKLESVIGKPPQKSTSRKITLGRKNSTKKELDQETIHWQGAYTELIMLLRHGILKEPERRWSAAQGFAAIDSVLRRWELPVSPCCGREAGSAASSSSRAQSPSEETWSDRDGSTIPSSLGHRPYDMLNTGVGKAELPATQFDPGDSRNISESEGEMDHYAARYTDPRRYAPEAVVETMYDDSVSVYTQGRDSVFAESIHFNEYSDWPTPPVSQQTSRSMHMMPSPMDEPIFELSSHDHHPGQRYYPGQQTTYEQSPHRKLPSSHPQQYQNKVHELPDSQSSSRQHQRHPESDRAPSSSRKGQSEGDVDRITNSVRKFGIIPRDRRG